MSKKAARRSEALLEIAQLRAKRRKDVATCVVALIVILGIVGAKTLLTAQGIISADNMAANAIVMFSAIGLAILGGSSSINFTKSGHRITYLRQRNGISLHDIKEHGRTGRIIQG